MTTAAFKWLLFQRDVCLFQFWRWTCEDRTRRLIYRLVM